MKLVYCATPARLKDRTKEIMDFVTEQKLGLFHPFQAFEWDRFEGGPVGREKTMEFCNRAVDICEEFWLFGISEDTLTELVRAKEKGKPVRKFYEQFDPQWREYYEKLAAKYGSPLHDL